MITIGIPFIQSVDAFHSRLVSTITIDSESCNLWVEVRHEYARFLCHERCDAFLIAVIQLAMRTRQDIVCQAPVSEDLLYQLNEYLIPSLSKSSTSLYPCHIDAAVDSSLLPSEGAVGTGISCGIDSLHVLAKHTQSAYKEHNVTHLALHNVGSNDVISSTKDLYKSRVELARAFCHEYGFKLVEVDSNFSHVIPYPHVLVHTYANLFAVYALRKLYSIYYYASGVPFNNFSIRNSEQYDCARYDLLSIDTFSTKSLRIYSEGSALSRYEKTRDVVNYEPSYRYLNICTFEGKNCCTCEKCIRTILALECLDALHLYDKVFDLELVKNKRPYYLQFLYQQHLLKNEAYNAEIYGKLKGQITPP